MMCVFIYDISNNRIRTRIAELCLDYGMERIQYSAFVGDLSAAHQRELMRRAVLKLGKHAGRLHLYPIGEREWALRREHHVSEEEACKQGGEDVSRG
ncbi:MAG: CRISPR-associated endonuclease Cas2 [Thermoflexales bacterium]|nr:CRISPR-associated endonuclease Cas2 [Thermoflexales bacterium]MDW8292834.1 CRISPR-associated endonuclease Cas2 [Anaerolineae bacterium]